MTALAGSIPFRSGEIESKIEVIRRIPGAPKNVEDTAIDIQFEGKWLRVLDPISLLASKLALVADVPQEGRHDGRHLRILIPCVRRFLEELLHEVNREEVPARHWLNVVRFLLKFTATKRARKIGSELGIDWNDTLPWAAIAGSEDEKLRRFLENQRPD